MRFLTKIFAIIGFLTVVGLVVAWFAGVKDLDPKAKDVYSHMAATLITTGDIAKATVVKREVKEGIDPDDVADSLKAVAAEMGIKSVGDLPLSKEMEARTGKKQRYIRVLSFCNPKIATDMVHYSMAFGAYLPCRVVIIEDPNGKYWLYTLDLDMMIHGGKKLPPKLLEEALRVRKTIYTMMDKAASGDF